MTKYLKPNSATAVKLAKFIKGICVSLASATFWLTNEHAPLISLLILVIGFVSNEAINFFSAKPGTQTFASKATKIALFFKGLCAVITTTAYFESGSKSALVVAVIGFIANEGINAFSSGGTSESPKGKDDQNCTNVSKDDGTGKP